jgi:hypothetical protein
MGACSQLWVKKLLTAKSAKEVARDAKKTEQTPRHLLSLIP